MDGNANNGLSHEQQGRLADWLAEREARQAVLGHAPPAKGTLDHRLRALDAAFETSPNRSDKLAEENHELRRTVEIYEEAIRQLLNGQLPVGNPTGS
ncbi:hypothetical protein ACWF94_29210 [Streptomyces sp. NPDC055078]